VVEGESYLADVYACIVYVVCMYCQDQIKPYQLSMPPSGDSLLLIAVLSSLLSYYYPAASLSLARRM
jgi:hypothetical protein